jgi:hypothetical protein
MDRSQVAMAHQLFFAEAVKWLGGEESFTGTISEAEDLPLMQTEQEDKVVFYLVIFGVPLLVVGAGVLLEMRSRRRQEGPVQTPEERARARTQRKKNRSKGDRPKGDKAEGAKAASAPAKATRAGAATESKPRKGRDNGVEETKPEQGRTGSRKDEPVSSEGEP